MYNVVVRKGYYPFIFNYEMIYHFQKIKKVNKYLQFYFFSFKSVLVKNAQSRNNILELLFN